MGLIIMRGWTVGSVASTQRDIVYVVSSVEQATKLGRNWCFTDGHAVEAVTEFFEELDPRSLVRCAAARRGDRTVYEVALDWRWLPGFTPEPGRNLGIAIATNDVGAPGGPRTTAEIVPGLLPRKRPSEFAGLRLAE